MAKKTNLINALESLPKIRHGDSFMHRLTPEQQVQVREALEWFKDHQPTDRPTLGNFCKTIKDEIGVSVSVATIRRLISDG